MQHPSALFGFDPVQCSTQPVLLFLLISNLKEVQHYKYSGRYLSKSNKLIRNVIQDPGPAFSYCLVISHHLLI